MLDKLLTFMDFACIDPRMYWRVPTLDGAQLFEIQWRRDDKLRWRFRKIGDLLWDLSSEQTLVHQLTTRGIDMQFFESKLKSGLLQQVAYADRVVRDARTILGADAVEQAIADQRSFLGQLEDAIAQLTKLTPTDKPKLRVIKDSEEALHH
ncbi:MAG TPA: hypothetical protein VE954_13710 [Oligoflexus sp.]|uniref:hypothetical protein n=1 Tax=Oligoflexus sp. TaxID=1971216 RepID=UPI002D65E021|nr:hypothetical protein [Oligoflexus sp.]HYX34156.1 hypothetical protein [Oligoflexus sp.]